jgi:hypothetical protein
MTAIYPLARGFVEALLDGASKLTRQALDRLPADRKAEFIEEVAGDLHAYETAGRSRTALREPPHRRA